MPLDELAKIADIPGLESKYEKHIDLLRGLVGCTYSHYLIYARMVQEDMAVACVLEDDVILTEQFSDLITTQRSFQAGSRLITVSDTVLEDIVNLKR